MPDRGGLRNADSVRKLEIARSEFFASTSLRVIRVD
jgi:hypothetical protein